MTPNGLGVRLSTDLDLQSQADELMQGKRGAVVLINAESGEILAMASHPTFDANQLDQNADELLADPQKPLINRAALGLYPIGSAIEPFAKIFYHKTAISQDELRSIQEAFNLFQAPELRMDTAQPTAENGVNELHVSPLQMALAAAGLSNDGILPAPRIALAVNTPQSGWVILPALGKPIEAVQSSAVNEALMSYIGEGENFWSHTGTAEEKDSHVTWFIGGTPPNWQASPLAVVVLLEESDEKEAQRIGQELLHDAMGP
jgi:cell division protein FtsI/penicillin-binding protein 2